MRSLISAAGIGLAAVPIAFGSQSLPFPTFSVPARSAAGTPAAPSSSKYASVPAAQASSALPEVQALPTDAAFLGTESCANCHEPNGRHRDEFDWYDTRDGVPGTNRLHKNAMNQLGDSEYQRDSEAFARAIDPSLEGEAWMDYVYEADGPCVRCHATVVNGYANEGVSCESCHGPAQHYLAPHKEPDNRAASIAAGMWNIYGKPEVWGAVCMNCHVLSDQRLIDAGHPDGADFDLGEKFQTTALHFLENRSTYTPATVAAIGEDYKGTIRANLAPPAGGVGGGDPVEDPRSGGAGNPGGGGEGSESARGGSGGEPGSEGSGTGAGGGRGGGASRPDADTIRIIERVIERVPTGSGAIVPVDPELQVVDSLPPAPAGVVATVQGRLATVLRVLLNNGATAPQRIVPEEEPIPYTGADAQLLRLQREIIELALEALSRPPRQQEQ